MGPIPQYESYDYYNDTDLLKDVDRIISVKIMTYVIIGQNKEEPF